MKTRKWMALILCAALCAAMISGCGSTQTNTETSDPQKTEDSISITDVTEASAAEPIVASEPEASADCAVEEAMETVTVALPEWPEEPVTFSMYKVCNPALTDMIAQGHDMSTWSVWKYVRENFNINFNVTWASMNDATTVYPLMFASGDYTDIFYTPSEYYSTGAVGLLEDGLIIDHLDLVKEYCPNMYAWLEKAGIEAYMTGNAMAGFFTVDQYEAYPEMGICIRQDWLDACDLEMPRTYDQLHDALTAFKNQMGADAALLLYDTAVMQRNALNAGYDVAALYSTRFNSGADAFYVVDGEVKYGPAEEGFYQYIEMLAQWYSEGLIYKDFYVPVSSFETVDTTVAQGRTGVFYDSVEDFYLIADTVDDGSCKIAGMYTPTIEEGSGYFIGSVSSTDADPVWCLTTACEESKQKYLAMLVNYFYDNGEGTLLANYGIEGEAFEYNENGEPQFTDLIVNNPNGYQTMMCYTFYTCEAQDPILYNNHRAYTGYTDDQWAAFDNWLNGYEDKMNYHGDLRIEEESDYVAYYADIATYINEYICSVIIGQQDLAETWDAYLAKLDSMGLQSVIEYRQHGYDDYYQD